MGGIDAGKGNLVDEFTFDIFVQVVHFGFCKGSRKEAVAEGIGVAGLTAALAFGGCGSRGGGHGVISFLFYKVINTKDTKYMMEGERLREKGKQEAKDKKGRRGEGAGWL